MQISFESPEKVGGVLTLTVEEGDYKADVEKKLKEYRRRANMPGFRPGQVPMGLIRRQMGNSVKVDIINELLGKEMQTGRPRPADSPRGRRADRPGEGRSLRVPLRPRHRA